MPARLAANFVNEKTSFRRETPEKPSIVERPRPLDKGQISKPIERLGGVPRRTPYFCRKSSKAKNNRLWGGALKRLQKQRNLTQEIGVCVRLVGHCVTDRSIFPR